MNVLYYFYFLIVQILLTRALNLRKWEKPASARGTKQLLNASNLNFHFTVLWKYRQ